uniref:hypothetical protein n=1 Tax=Acetatifactor sp. TaxID=1872090 RepID=UPI004056F20A
MINELRQEDLECVEGGCTWCYVGGGLVILGGFLTGGLGGAGLAALGVAGVLLT